MNEDSATEDEKDNWWGMVEKSNFGYGGDNESQRAQKLRGSKEDPPAMWPSFETAAVCGMEQTGTGGTRRTLANTDSKLGWAEAKMVCDL